MREIMNSEEFLKLGKKLWRTSVQCDTKIQDEEQPGRDPGKGKNPEANTKS